MTSLNRRSTKSEQDISPSQQGVNSVPPQESDSSNLHGMISKRAYELHCERGYRDSGALADGLDAEQGILSKRTP